MRNAGVVSDRCSDKKKHLLLVEKRNAYFWGVWRKYNEKVFAFCFFRLTKNHHDAEDLCSETMIKAYCKISKINEDINILSWLIRIAKNTHFDAIRRQKVFLRYQCEINNEDAVFECIDSVREEQSIAMLKFVEDQINLMPDEKRLILRGYFFQGKGYRQLSEENCCTEAYVRKKIFNSRRHLKCLCDKHFGGI